MRVPLLLFALAFAPLALAQTTTGPNESAITSGMETLRDKNPLAFELTGTETVAGGKRTPVHAVLYWRLSQDPRTKADTKAEVELDLFTPTPTGEVVTMRIVGDGTTLRRYDLVRREVVSTDYGFYGPTAPANFAQTYALRLMKQLRDATPGAASYLARLLTDLMPAGLAYAPAYSGWMPGYPSTTLLAIPDEASGGKRKTNVPEILEDDSVVDPITGRTYVEGNGWVMYGVNMASPPRTLAFELDDPSTGQGIKTVYIADRTAGRVRDLVIVPSVPATLPSYVFQPITGAAASTFRPLARP